MPIRTAIVTKDKRTFPSMNIIMTLPYPEVQGPLNEHIPLLIKELEKSEVEVTSFYYGKHRDKVAWYERLLCGVKNLFLFTRLLYRVKADLVQINSSFDKRALVRDCFFALIAKGKKKKVFFKMHGSLDNLMESKSVILRLFTEILIRTVDCIGVLSNIEKELYIEKFGKHKNKIIVVKNPLNVKQFNVNIQRLSIGTKINRVLYASRIIRQKGIYDFLNAIPSIPDKNRLAFVIAGAGADESHAQQMIKNMNIGSRITWLGQIPSQNMPAIYLSADILVFPSHYPEGMPMTIMSALGFGLPIITTKTRFALEFLKENANCLFFEKDNPSDLSKKILELSSNPELMQKMSKSNREIVQMFDKELVSKEYMSIYQQLI